MVPTIISQPLISLAHTDAPYFFIYLLYLKIMSTVQKSISVMNENVFSFNKLI